MKKWLIIGGLILILGGVGVFVGLKYLKTSVGLLTINEAIHKTGDFFEITYASEKHNPAAKSYKFEGLKIVPRIHEEFRLEIGECVAALAEAQSQKDIPPRIKLFLSQVRITDPAFEERLAELGYQDLVLEVAVDIEYWLGEGRLTVHELSITAPGAGDLSCFIHLDGLEVNLETTLVDLFFEFKNALLVLAQVKFTDDSLVNRLRRVRAAEESKTEDQVRQEAMDELSDRIQAEENPIKAQAMEALLNFLRRPGSIVVRAKPLNPMPLNLFMKAAKFARGDWPADLNLTVGAE